MILTHCAQCAAPLDNKAPRCGICKTRYCGRDCQKMHWKQGGHKAICQEIKRGGGAEQYHADKKLKEAVAVAAEACAEDTKGQTCYICTQALHWKTKEGLVRGCSCRGTAGFAHVSCLAEQAKILVAEAKENNKDSQWHRWHTCSLCEQQYHGVVKCALGWACWKTYVGRPETNWPRVHAMTELGNGIFEENHYEDVVSLREAQLAIMRRIGASEERILTVQGNLAATYAKMGRKEEALSMFQDIYSGRVRLNGEEYRQTIIAALNYADTLRRLQRFEEAKALLRKTIPAARRVLGDSKDLTLRIRVNYAMTLYRDPSATLDDLREAVKTLEEAGSTAQRVLGGEHPTTVMVGRSLRNARYSRARAALRARETPPARADAIDARGD